MQFFTSSNQFWIDWGLGIVVYGLCLSSYPLGHTVMHIVLVQLFVSCRVSFVKNITTRRSNSFSIITLFYPLIGGVHCIIYIYFFFISYLDNYGLVYLTISGYEPNNFWWFRCNRIPNQMSTSGELLLFIVVLNCFYTSKFVWRYSIS